MSLLYSKAPALPYQECIFRDRKLVVYIFKVIPDISRINELINGLIVHLVHIFLSGSSSFCLA